MTNQDPDIRETHDLIASDMVVGTNVYDIQGNHIGQVERLILEKRGGRVSYAVLSFGGFLGIGDDYYPLPWRGQHGELFPAVAARVDDGEVYAATAILAQSGSVDIGDRRNEYEASGWSAFDESAGPWNPADRDAGPSAAIALMRMNREIDIPESFIPFRFQPWFST